MRIALVLPTIQVAFQDGLLPSPPLGLMYLATQVKTHHKVKIFDFYSQPAPPSIVLKRIMRFEPDVVGVSTIFSSMYHPALQLCIGLKQRQREIVTVLGGNTATFLSKDTTSYDFVDFVVLNEGEGAFMDLLAYIEGKSCYPHYNVISASSRNYSIQWERDIDKFGIPSWEPDIFDRPLKYSKVIMSTRGCPYMCSYCSTAAHWTNKYRRRSLEITLKEINTICNENPDGERRVSFADDLFTLDRKRVIEFGAALKENEIKWGCSARVDTVDKSLIKKMAEDGCDGIFFGVETGSDWLLKKINRKYNVDMIKNTVKWCAEVGIQSYVSFIIGLPWETEEDVHKTFKLVEAMPTNHVRIGPLQVFPGTPMWNNPEFFGLRFQRDRLSDVDVTNNVYVDNGIIPPSRLATLSEQARRLCQSKM